MIVKSISHGLASAPSLRPVLLWFAMALCLTAVVGVSANTHQSLTIGRIEFEGLQRLTADEVIASSGLKLGQTFDVTVLDRAAQKLADSGLFKNLGYKTRRAGNAVTIIFQVEESKAGNSPVLFDNFIWFSDEELAEAVRRQVPTFAGTAPNAGETVNSIVKALQKLLIERNLKGVVEHMPSEDEQVFTVTGVNIPVCTLHFPGARNVSEDKLISNSREFANTDYSKKVASVFAVTRLFPLYREVGQLRATFGDPLAKPDAKVSCNGGADVTIPVDEGLIYSWEKSEWTDNHAVAAPELEAALGMKAGEVANGLKVDKGLIAVGKRYGRKGYLDLRLEPRPEYDDVTRRVTYKIAVNEGPQYRMGNLILKGYSETAGRLFRAKWEMNTGDIFDIDYVDEFGRRSGRDVMQQVAEEYRTLGRALPKVLVSQESNRKNLTVDVTFEIKN